MARRGRTFSLQDMTTWAPFVSAGQEMDRRIRTRHLPVQNRPSQTAPQDVISDEEYPFGHGGVFEVPMSGDENG